MWNCCCSVSTEKKIKGRISEGKAGIVTSRERNGGTLQRKKRGVFTSKTTSPVEFPPPLGSKGPANAVTIVKGAAAEKRQWGCVSICFEGVLHAASMFD